jgi:hypothetical protein
MNNRNIPFDSFPSATVSGTITPIGFTPARDVEESMRRDAVSRFLILNQEVLLTEKTDVFKVSNDLDQDLLCGILRIGGIPEHPKSKPIHAVLNAPDERLEGILVAVSCLLHQIFEGCFHL